MVLAIVRRNWQMYKRYFPIALFMNRLISIAFEILGFWLLAHYLFQNHVSAQGIDKLSDYFTYASVGMIFYNVAVAVMMNVGRALITEVREGTLESLLVSPYQIVKYYWGVYLEQFVRTFLEFIASYLIAFLFGANVLSISFFNWGMGFIYISFISFTLGVFLSNIMLWLRETFISQNTLFVVIFLVSGITFPRSVLPVFLRVIGDIIPLTQSLGLLRSLYYDPQLNLLGQTDFYISLVSALLYFGVGLYVYQKIEQRVIGYVSY